MPIQTIPLGPLDHIAPRNIPQSIIYLSLKQDVQSQEAFECLQEGLRKTLLQVPWLGGRVYWQSRDTQGWRPGQLEIRYGLENDSPQCSELFRFNHLDGSASFNELKEAGFPLDEFADEDLLWVSPFELDFEAGAPVFAAQANFLTGGCLLVLSIAAPASDGTAMLTITKLWADHCSSLAASSSPLTGLLPPPTPEGSSRMVLDVAWGKERGVSSPELPLLDLQQLVGLDPQPTANNNHLDMTPYLFYMPHTAYTTLRRECTTQFGPRTPISGNDLICALIWRTTARAWQAQHQPPKSPSSPSPAKATLAMLFDARPDLTDSLPPLHLGNLNFEHRLHLPLATLTDPSTTIPQIAHTIRLHAKTHTRRDVLLNAYGLLQATPDYQQELRASRMALPLFPSSSAVEEVELPVGILSPMLLPFNDTCFGEVFGNGGRPEGFRPLMGRGNRGYRTCFVVPRKRHGGIEFVMTLGGEVEF
ncbi:hypothetical protein N0V88_004800 [Collariella sp. IMI 366227]|nr:hypothetical protein N0V88_004800 [Collariella sp. IMI 366227]